MRKISLDYADQETKFQEVDKTVENHLKNIVPKRFWGSRIGMYETGINDVVKSFCLDDSGQVFILSGNIGTGKTTLAFGAMYERAYNGLDVGEYLSAKMLCPLLRAKQSFTSPESEYDFLIRMGKVPFLVYDEAGKADDKDIEWNFLTKILALRHDNMLNTFIITNMDLAAFSAFIKKYGNGDDIYTRLKTNLITRSLQGPCRRKEIVA